MDKAASRPDGTGSHTNQQREGPLVLQGAALARLNARLKEEAKDVPEVDRHRWDHVNPEILRHLPLGLEPGCGRLIVMRMRRESRTKGGLEIPEEARDLMHMGYVISLSPLCAAPLEPGDVVVWGKWAGGEYVMDNRDRPLDCPYVTITERDIWSLELQEEDPSNG